MNVMNVTKEDLELLMTLAATKALELAGMPAKRMSKDKLILSYGAPAKRAISRGEIQPVITTKGKRYYKVTDYLEWEHKQAAPAKLKSNN